MCGVSDARPSESPWRLRRRRFQGVLDALKAMLDVGKTFRVACSRYGENVDPVGERLNIATQGEHAVGKNGYLFAEFDACCRHVGLCGGKIGLNILEKLNYEFIAYGHGDIMGATH